jgi:methyltransferase
MTMAPGYLMLLALVAIQRVMELFRSRRNEAAMRRAGASEHGGAHYPWMVAMHALFLPACAAEVLFLGRPFHPLVGGIALVVLAAAMALRVWTLRTLGDRWTTRVIVVPGRPLVTTGPYRWLRHPNYLAVVLEFLAIPLVHGAWVAAAVFSLANLVVLAIRIRVEERALAEAVP